mgnify:CR=1 FL=1
MGDPAEPTVEADAKSDLPLSQAVGNSRMAAAWRWIVATTCNSYVYQWLTKEPDPDVIVIDLRETWTVGPAIRLVDAGISRLSPAVTDSRTVASVRTGYRATVAAPAVVAGRGLLVVGLLILLASIVSGSLTITQLGFGAIVAAGGAAATRERRSWAELCETRPIELCMAALEPPEPPADGDTTLDDDHADRTTAGDKLDETHSNNVSQSGDE